MATDPIVEPITEPITEPAPTDPPVAAAPPADPPADPAPAPTGWEADRIRIAGGDEKLLKRLERYGTSDEMIKAGIEAQTKIGQGLKAKGEPGKDATEGEVIDWRKANNVPEAADKYELKLDEGLVVGDADKPLVDGFLELAHSLNLSNEKTSAIVNAQLKMNEQFLDQRAQNDTKAANEARAELQNDTVWGNETKRNLNMVNAFLDTAPEGIKDMLWSARTTDGTPIGSKVDFLVWINSVARQQNPLGTVVPASGMTQLDTVDGEIAGIMKEMAKGSKGPYYKGDGAQKMQDRLLELNTMKEKHETLHRK